MTEPGRLTRIAGLSIPKAGTHLLVGIFRSMGYATLANPKGAGRKILEGLVVPAEPRLYVYGHWRYGAETDDRLSQAGFQKIVLIRDPRDICLSMADYLASGRPPGVLEREPALAALPLKALQLMVIEGIRLPGHTTHPIGKICEGWLPWVDHGAVLLRYEDVGEAAVLGRTNEALRPLGVDPQAFLGASQQRFRPKPTRYRWETEFDDELREAWRRHAPGVAAALGYPEI